MILALDKSALRTAALASRGIVSGALVDTMATRLADIGPRIAQDHAAANVSAYWAIGAEIATLPLITALHAAGFKVALPITGQHGTALIFRRWAPGAIMVAGRMKIMEPRSDAALLEPDLLFVPLAAFDRRGHRIGYGAGFYDRSLAALRAKKPIVAVGVAYATQEVSNVPNDAHDQTLDFILTERELIRVGA